MTNLFIISLPVVITINLLLGVVVVLTHMQRLANRVFAVLSLMIALWLVCQYFGSTASSETWLMFWIRQACAASVFIPLLFHLLRDSVARSAETLLHLVRRSWLWVAAAIATAVLCQTRLFLVGARISTEANALAEPVYGSGFILFVVFWVVTVASLVWSFFRSLAQSEGVCRMELQIMSLGSLLGLVPGVLLVLVIPLLTGSSQSARFTPITVVIWHSVIAYGIATRHIMGVGEFLRHTITGVFLAGVLTVLYILTFRLAHCLPVGPDDLRQTAAHVIAAIAVALTLAPANTFLRRGADRLFDDGHDELSYLLQKGGDLTRFITTVDTLSHDFSRLLLETLKLSHVHVFLRSGSFFCFIRV